ncbi:hypothetical protein [Streptomyces canus]|uniref:hypothetical protein n=1 Tax=Streptomyces canus TaxID=58343 RepID=UPI00074A97A3|nr:hypothetical protein [Streptomyces canus]KUN02200.1 hypothetical protein AQI96_40285 [Streptomyces canus]
MRRDHAGRDGIGELLTLNSSGALTFQQGKGKGTFSDKVSGSGWPTSVRAAPFGDLSGDRCNDVLVRLSSGALRAGLRGRAEAGDAYWKVDGQMRHTRRPPPLTAAEAELQ